MNKNIASRLKNLKLETPQTYRNIAVYPVTDGKGGNVKYITLAEALEGRLLNVRRAEKDDPVKGPGLRQRHDRPRLLLLTHQPHRIGILKARECEECLHRMPLSFPETSNPRRSGRR